MKQGKLIIPHWKDARYALLVFLSLYVVYAISSPAFVRTPGQFIASILTCLSVDAFLSFFYKKIPLVPVSGLITSLGTFLLVDSPSNWPYALVAAVSILSKHFITIRGRHVFNPNNFGLVVGLLYFRNDVVSEAARWGGIYWMALGFIVIGMFVVWRAHRTPLALSYVFFFAVGVFIRTLSFHRSLIAIGAPATGAGFQLFTFYMISDPKTSPRQPAQQVLFGAAVAILDTLFRVNQSRNAAFYSLFLVTAAYSFLRQFEDARRTQAFSKAESQEVVAS